MNRTKNLAALITILLIALITAHALTGHGTTPNTPETSTLYNWAPTQATNSQPPAQTQSRAPPEVQIAIAPYSAHEIVFTLTNLAENTTVSGTVTYGPAANIIQEKIYINGTPAKQPPTPDPFTKLMDKIAKIITLTPGEALSNESITILGPEITLNTTNTHAIITLIEPSYAYITYTTTPITADLRWLKPHTPTTTTRIDLPIVNNPDLDTVYSNNTLTIYSPTTVNGEIVTEYDTSSTLYYIILFNDRVIYNGTLLTPLYRSLIATNTTTTVHLTILTDNPIYSIPPVITCTKIGNAHACRVGTTTIAFNGVIISFRYTTTVNGAALTVHGWMAYPGDNEPHTEITVKQAG